ncbi:MAG TPA: hypothetical protein VLQ45_11765 [Thermoanaerobaculia bacterium]|nr:hypothetical protein [Thermoanaerobaculia bacterium]
MLRKSTMLRLLCAAVLAVTAAFGAFTITAEPAHALYCPDTFLGCEFDRVQDYGNMICCVYACPTGNERVGNCEQTW